MIRRGYGNGDSLPTHGGSEGLGSSFSTGRGYGGYNGGSSSGIGGMYGGTSKYSKKKHAGYSNLAIVALGMAIFNIILTGLWLNSRGHYRSLMQGFNARDSQGVIDKIKWTEKEVSNVKHEMMKESRQIESRFPKIKQLEKDNKRWMSERDKLREKYESPAKKKEDARLKQREPAHLKQIGLMQQAIRKESRRTVLERFGPGPHEVQMTFVYNNQDYDFVIELAPLHTVPHAIHLFLEQVEHGLWAGTYFYINTIHVLQAGPWVENGIAGLAAGQSSRSKRFEDVQLDMLAFPDYSNEFPHSRWTVGFAGRPGGPDFFINKLDNVALHGPGGQIHHALEEQADSCFGRITKGQEHFENLLFPMPKMDTGDHFHDFLKEQVPIVRAVILTPKPQEGTPIVMEEFPEPIEIEFARSLMAALAPWQQTSIDNSTVEVKLDAEAPTKLSAPAVMKDTVESPPEMIIDPVGTEDEEPADAIPGEGVVNFDIQI